MDFWHSILKASRQILNSNQVNVKEETEARMGSSKTQATLGTEQRQTKQKTQLRKLERRGTRTPQKVMFH